MASSLQCKLQILGAKNIRAKHKGALFIRTYLFSGNNSRIQLNTPEIILPSTLNADFIFWDDADFSLECKGTEDSIAKLKQDTVIFELRSRKTTSLFGKIGKSSSQLLARGEIPWRNIFETPKMEMQMWVCLIHKKLEQEDVEPLALKVAVKVEYPVGLSAEEMRKRRRGRRLRQEDECGCCADNELLFVTGVFDAL